MTLTSTPDRATPASAGQRRPSAWVGLWAVPEIRWASIATALFAAGGLAQLAEAPPWVYWGLYLICYVTGGWEPGWEGLKALKNKTLDVDLLMIVAAVAAAAIGQVFDGALLIVIFATSGALEAWATRRTADSVRALLDLTPEQATRLTDDSGGSQIVPAADLEVGDRILVRPGEQVAADGTVVDGASDVDQSSITGEPIPAVKLAGSEVFAGTMNGTGALTIQVNRPPGDTVLARIVSMVEQASATKAKTQLFIEKVEQRYSIAVVVIALALIAIPLTVGAEFQPTLLRAMTFMIVASPCAVVLATMPPLLASIANAGRHGVLVKSAVVMEKLAAIDAVAFDKTGTLTEGRPRLADLIRLPSATLSHEELLGLAAAVEERSEHPIATAIVAAARDRDLVLPAPVTAFTSTPGRGVAARVSDRHVLVGSTTQIDEALPAQGHHLALQSEIKRLESVGATTVVLAVDGRPEAVLALTDQLRHDSNQTVKELTQVLGRSPALLSGDNPAAVRSLAAEVGIADVRGGLLPADKVSRVQQLQESSKVLLVGDGVNDAPALATAHVGIAMGRRGSDLALETADAVIVRDELSVLPRVLGLARRARRVVIANLIFAAAVIVTLVTWDLVGELPLTLGVAGHETSTIVVGLNGLRLLRQQAWESSYKPRPRPSSPT